MDPSSQTERLTVLYDGACPLCRREIAHVRGLAQQEAECRLDFVDVSAPGGARLSASERSQLLARFHVERADGTRLSGAAAFVAMWQRLPGWRWLARLASLPGMLWFLEMSYRLFLRARPGLQAFTVWVESRRSLASTAPKPALPGLDTHMIRELRSDHAGETGAVFIYRGIEAVARRRGDADLLAFAQRHQATEREHLHQIESWLPPRKRSRLLGPWRLAGWLTGALPALFGRRAVHATIAAVETFVDYHYQQQIDYLQRRRATGGQSESPEPLSAGDPSSELLALLQHCQADERAHRDEAAALAGSVNSWFLRAWCALVGGGSRVAVTLARRF